MTPDKIAAAKARLEAYDRALEALTDLNHLARKTLQDDFSDRQDVLEEHAPEDLRLALAEIDGEGSRKALALFEIESLRIDLEKQRLDICRLQAMVAKALALPAKWRDSMSKTNVGLGADMAIAYEDAALDSCAEDIEDALGIGHPPRPAEVDETDFPRATIRRLPA
jgi:hypothetical protein